MVFPPVVLGVATTLPYELIGDIFAHLCRVYGGVFGERRGYPKEYGHRMSESDGRDE